MTPELLTVVPVALPLLGAAVAALLRKYPRARRAWSLLVVGTVLVVCGLLLPYVDRHDVLVVHVGGWNAQLGIALVVDRLSALLLLVSAVVLFLVLCYSYGQRTRRGTETEPMTFHPVYLTLAAGVFLAFVSGDLFNLFVAFEIMLGSSYVLIMLPPDQPRIRAGTTYVVVSLTSSILFLTTVGLIYAATGTVNLALLSHRIAELPNGLATSLGMLLLVAFGIKAAIVPLHFWLPDSYPTALSMVTALFAALLTKVAVYALIRTQTLLFPRDDASDLLLALALVTMIIGALGALRQDDLNRVLSFLLVSHIGFMVFGLALFSIAGLRGAIIYLVHHIVVQATLFQVSGLVQEDTGTVSLSRSSGVVHRTPGVGALFLVAALSLSGVPPLSGFVAKLALIQAGVRAAHAGAWVVTASVIAASLLTLAAMARVWIRMFWREPASAHPREEIADNDRAPHRDAWQRPLMAASAAAVLVVGFAIAAFAGPIAAYTDRAAEALMAPSAYRTSVVER